MKISFLLRKKGPPERPFWGNRRLQQLVKKVFFDKLLAVFQNLKSSEKPVIANERHP